MGTQIQFGTPNFVPESIEEAVDTVIDLIDEDNTEAIKGGDVEAYMAHHGLGRTLRNQWLLWENDTPIKHNAVKQYGIAHADDLSSLILNWAWARIRGTSFDPQEFARDEYHKHWENEGTDAITAGGYK